jgi:hypothetical protein
LKKKSLISAALQKLQAKDAGIFHQSLIHFFGANYLSMRTQMTNNFDEKKKRIVAT